MQEALTSADSGSDLRARAARLVMEPLFQKIVIGLILFNAVTLGLETSETISARWGGVLAVLDRALLVIFTAEVALRIYAFRGRFFRDPWGLFDLAIITIAWLPATGPLSVLRALRILRVLRLISVVPSMRLVVEAMLHALPGMGSIVMLMGLIFYVFAVMATKLYGEILPDRFGSLGSSLYTLFQMMTLESWSEANVRPILAQQPLAWMFFVPFILIATFVVLNLFIGVIVDSIQTLRKQREASDPAAVAADAHTRELEEEQHALLREIRALRAEVAALREAQPKTTP
ncbi:ion transporter [Roseococcus suduntuyensis]|uniref:Voltage-gated sodium channel n=1 Tax=Roseococcus suduntuyensis TaxID=455361 RepID=A0A840A767_9PROT|nr:ion transporter [Roseococcus suduntuyensis]MBB3897349.1 voltage-gated sodium channel [Roseococcus suduntuyensis]